MKHKIFTLIFTLFVSITMLAQNKYEKSYIYFQEPIDSINVTINSKIIINENVCDNNNNQTVLRVYTIDKYIYDNIDFVLKDNILYIKQKQNCNLIEFNPDNIKIRIISPSSVPVGTTNGFTIKHSNLRNDSGKSTI